MDLGRCESWCRSNSVPPREECGDIIRVILNTPPLDAEAAGPAQLRYRKALVRIGRQLANLGALRKSLDPNQAVDVLWFYFGYSGLCPPHQPPAWGCSASLTIFASLTILRIGLPAARSGF